MKLRREWGPRGSFVLSVPRDKVRLLGWTQGDELTADCDGKRLVITNISRMTPQSATQAGTSEISSPQVG